MKNKIHKTSIAFLFSAFFLLGFQQDMNAQLFVTNDTPCYLFVQLNEGPTCKGATWSESQWIAPIQTVQFQIQGNWVSVDYGVTIQPGEIPSPPPFTGKAFYSSSCGIDTPGNCGAVNLTHSWVSGSPPTTSTLTISQ